MKLLIIFSLGILLAHALTEEQLWKEFKNKHGKSYDDVKEEQHRYRIFLDNVKRINEHNKKYERGEVTWYQKVTKFADWTENEYTAWLNRNIASRPKLDGAQKYQARKISDAPEAFSWRDHAGVVSEIKDQGDCGSCWAFSATGGLEAQNFFKHNASISLSEQQMVDCSGYLGNEGCQGGNMNQAFEYAIKNGIQTEESYPYVGKDAECLYDPTKVVVRAELILEIEQSEVSLVPTLVDIGPISAAINANPLSYYGGGIFNVEECPSEFFNLNHGVLIVGYGVEDGLPYWVVKNSWGLDWGEDGYFRIVRHLDNATKGMCGLAQMMSYALVK